jgi:hypothetical protein
MMSSDNDCDQCHKLTELYYNEKTGLALCESCDRLVNAAADKTLRCDICQKSYPFMDVYVSPGDGFSECKNCSPHLWEKVEANQSDPGDENDFEDPGEPIDAEPLGEPPVLVCNTCGRTCVEPTLEGMTCLSRIDAGMVCRGILKKPWTPTFETEEDVDPDTWPYTYLKDFIERSILAIKMVSVPDNPGSVRHEPNGCKHCKALKALDLLVDQHRTQVGELLMMIVSLGKEKDAEIVNLQNRLANIFHRDERRLDTIKQLREDLAKVHRERNAIAMEAEACAIELHDSKQHELGAKCAELQDKLEDVTLIVMASPNVPSSIKDSIKRIVKA